jgi:hypothetical protein
MNTFAYCCASFGRRMRRLAGTRPLLCPPTTDGTFDLELLRDRDFVWFKLHGRRNERTWYGDTWTTALSAERLARADLAGAVVFVSNCWLTDEAGMPGPMLVALAQAGAHAIIGGSGKNYAATNMVHGTDLLGLYVRVFLGLGFAVTHALRFAKARLRLRRQLDLATSDALRFTLWRPTTLPAPCGEPTQPVT